MALAKNLIALILAVTIAPPALLATPTLAAQDCSDQVRTSCTACHYQTRICEKLDNKSRRDWRNTLNRMLRYGLVLDEAGQGRILDCLMALKSDHAKLCK